jgi:hypothetical protein
LVVLPLPLGTLLSISKWTVVLGIAGPKNKVFIGARTGVSVCISCAYEVCDFWFEAGSQLLVVTREIRVSMMLRESEFRLKTEMKSGLYPLLSR